MYLHCQANIGNGLRVNCLQQPVIQFMWILFCLCIWGMHVEWQWLELEIKQYAGEKHQV